MARQMIPCTDEVMARMMGRVMEVLRDHGMVDVTGDEEEIADRAMEVLRSQGAFDESGQNIVFGRCLLLSTNGPEISLLAATPCPTDEFNADLSRKASPVRFDRTAEGRIIIPGRWILGKLEDLNRNPSVPEQFRAFWLNVSRRGVLADVMLPSEVETIALHFADRDGKTVVIEALPAGFVVSLDPEVTA